MMDSLVAKLSDIAANVDPVTDKDSFYVLDWTHEVGETRYNAKH